SMGRGRARGLGVAPRAPRSTLLGVCAEDASATRRRHVTASSPSLRPAATAGQYPAPEAAPDQIALAQPLRTSSDRLQPAEGAAEQQDAGAPEPRGHVVEHDAGPAREVFGGAGGPGLELVEDAEGDEADDQRAGGGGRGDPGDQDAGHLVDAHDLRVLGPQAPLDAPRRPDADGRHHHRGNGHRDGPVRAQQQIKRNRAQRPPGARGERQVATPEPDRQHVRQHVGRRPGWRGPLRRRAHDCQTRSRSTQSNTSRRMATPFLAVASSMVSAGWMRKLAAYAIVNRPRRTASLKIRSVTWRGSGALVFLSETSSIRISSPAPSTKPTNG